MRKILPFILAAFVIAAILLVCFLPNGSGSETPGGQKPSTPAIVPDTSAYADRDVSGRNVAYVTMNIQYDTENGKVTDAVKLLLDATSAPRTVANFLAAAKSGFYDGLEFFMAEQYDTNSSLILGGDPTVNGDEPWQDTVVGECTSNGYNNDLKIKRGVITMYHTNYSLDDASTCFFFSTGDITDVDPYYAPFGYIISGYATIENILKLGIYYTDNNNYGLILKSRRPVITSITIEQDIDYSLIRDIYAAPLTADEMTEALGADHDAKRTSVISNHPSLIRAYISKGSYLLQLFGKIGDNTENVILTVDNNGKILSAEAILPLGETLSTELASIVGLDLKSIDAAEISDGLKTMVKDALSADLAVFSATDEEIKEAIGDVQVKSLTVETVPSTFVQAFTCGDNYLLQMIRKGDDGLAHLLVHVSKDGKILGAKALAQTADALAAQTASIIGLELSTVSAAEISDVLKTLVKDSISVAVDASIVNPTADEIAAILGNDNQANKVTISYASATITHSYTSKDDYLFQMVGKSDDGLALLLVHVSKAGKILGVKPLSATTGSLAEQVSSMVGLDLASLNSAVLPDGLRTLASDALRTITAINADDSKSKYVYTRDTEDRETYTVEMKVEGYDTPVVILLDKTTAPITVENFIALVKKGFYDGLDFHRIIKGFMIQGGDDSHLAADKQAANIPGEFASNGWYNDIKHIRGTISMARASDPNSAASGFFICDAEASHLDGDYAAFGYVLSGMETVDAIADYATGKTDSNGNLNTGVAQPTIEYIKILESAN